MPWIRVEAALVHYFAFFQSFLELDEKKNWPTSRACLQETKSLVASIFWGLFNKRLINNDMALISQY